MNVLLAEAKVLRTTSCSRWTRSTTTSPSTDVVLVIGANDIVNPGGARRPEQPDRRHAGAGGVEGKTGLRFRSGGMATGYSGVDNPLFYKDNTAMFLRRCQDQRRSAGAGNLIEPIENLIKAGRTELDFAHSIIG